MIQNATATNVARGAGEVERDDQPLRELQRTALACRAQCGVVIGAGIFRGEPKRGGQPLRDVTVPIRADRTQDTIIAGVNILRGKAKRVSQP